MAKTKNGKTKDTTPYQRTQLRVLHDIVLGVLAAVSVTILVLEETRRIPDDLRHVYLTIDFAIALLFLTEWVWGYVRAPSKRSYWANHWYELLASIPLELPLFEALRGLRIIRLIQVFRIAHVSNHIKSVSANFLNDVGIRLMSLITTAGTVILSGTVVFHQFEYGVNPMVRGFFDSIWWAFTTTTWTSVGDVYPVTWEGRVTAMALTLFGVGVLSSLIGFITKYILKQDASSLKLIQFSDTKRKR